MTPVNGTTWEKKKRNTEAEMDGLCQPRHESHRDNMKFMTELAGGELCLPQRPHNQVVVARTRRMNMHELFCMLYDLHRETISFVRDI